ncbi:MAG: hypothetical protein KAX31_00855, partial [Thermoplasmata archaeon]|nr:hypothetical protein [Thermoplasmata archaeon]
LKKGFEREFIELTYEAEKVISNSKKFGINVKEAEAMFKTAREQKEVNYQMALETLKRSIETVRTAVQEFKPNLTAMLTLRKMERGVWVDTELVILNEGKALAKDVKLNFLGDVSIQGDLKLDSVRGVGGEEVLPVKLKFDNLGDMPVIVKMQSTRIMDGTVFHDESVVNVFIHDQDLEKVTTADVKAVQFAEVKAQAETKCNICMGKVKAGLDIVKCSCGSEYHSMCIKRFGKCTGCGTAFSEDQLGAAEKEEDTIGDLDAPVKAEEDGDKLKKDGVIVEPEPAADEGEPPESQSKEEEPKEPTKKRLALKF